MAKWMIILVLSIGLSAFTLSTFQENRILKQQVISLVQASASTSPCPLPAFDSSTIDGTVRKISFPRNGATIILGSDRDCTYCQSALAGFADLSGKFPRLKPFLHDPRHTYSASEIAVKGPPGMEITISEGRTVLDDLLQKTPTVLLVSPSGTVLGRWSGELSTYQLNSIRFAIESLL